MLKLTRVKIGCKSCGFTHLEEERLDFSAVFSAFLVDHRVKNASSRNSLVGQPLRPADEPQKDVGQRMLRLCETNKSKMAGPVVCCIVAAYVLVDASDTIEKPLGNSISFPHTRSLGRIVLSRDRRYRFLSKGKPKKYKRE